MKQGLILATLIFFCGQPGHCAPTFKEAVSDYNAGKYALALQQFNAWKAKSPNNALTRYYLALCHQALNHKTEARAEYQWVSSYGDPTLKSHAAKGLAQLGVMSAGSGSSSAPAVTNPGQNAPPVASGPSRVKRILEFYADW
jgi:tetratricopeptide (TPR) repeat protein